MKLSPAQGENDYKEVRQDEKGWSGQDGIRFATGTEVATNASGDAEGPGVIEVS